MRTEHTIWIMERTQTNLLVWSGSEHRQYNMVRSHQLCLWCGHHHCTRRNETHNVSTRNLIVKAVESGLGEAILKTHLHVEKTRGYPLSYLIRSLSLCGHPCKGIQQGLEGGLHTSRYIGTKILVIDVNLYLYHCLASAFTLCTLVVCLTFST